MFLLYILNKDEENLLKLIIKHARIDYFRNNNRYFDTEDIDEIEIEDKANLKSDMIKNYESGIQVNELEKIFTEKNMFKIAKTLTYNEKLVLFLYYVEGKKDREIAEVLSCDKNTVYMRRFRTIEKIERWRSLICLIILI